MSTRTFWYFGFSIFFLLVLVSLAGFTHAATPALIPGPILEPGSFSLRLAQAAKDRTAHEVSYDPAYVSLAYPGGDVPADKGVCTDVIIRAYRALGVDLQQLVHEDMAKAFAHYPKNWGLSRPDSNIDHRRVPNLQRFFARHGDVLAATKNGSDYKPGDLVTWTVPPYLPHIGIVANVNSADGERPLIVHNIGAGPRMEDRLFDFPITGHYRFSGL